MNRIPSKIKTFGDSMAPILLNNDVVFLKKKRLANIYTDDIVCARKNRKIFTHRVIYKSSKYLIMAGDNNFSIDGKIYPSQIIGVVYQIKRGNNILSIESPYLIQSTIYFQEIAKLKNSLQKRRINFVFLKGLPLHLYYEKRYPKRIYRDCDILVSREYFLKTKSMLEKMGYRVYNKFILQEFRKGNYEHDEINFYKAVNGVLVIFDIHQTIVFMPHIKGLELIYPKELKNKLTAEFLLEKIVVRVGREKFPVLSINNFFIYTALHLFHHNFIGTFRYELLEKLSGRVEHFRASDKIKKYKLQNFVYPVYLLLKKYYGVKFPENFLESIKPSNTAKNFAEKIVVKEELFKNIGRVSTGVKRFKNLFYLSPTPIYKKIWVFVEPHVFSAILTVLYIRFKINLNYTLKNFNRLSLKVNNFFTF